MPTENGCVFARPVVRAPRLAAPAAPRTSASGVPVRRSSRNSSPRLVPCTSAGTVVPSACGKSNEHRLRRHVVVPDVVMHGLERPAHRAVGRRRARRPTTHTSPTLRSDARRSSRASRCRSARRRGRARRRSSSGSTRSACRACTARPRAGSVLTPGRPMSHAHANLPVITSNARTTPDGSSTSRLSMTQPPMIARPRAIVGGEVTK